MAQPNPLAGWSPIGQPNTNVSASQWQPVITFLQQMAARRPTGYTPQPPTTNGRALTGFSPQGWGNIQQVMNRSTQQQPVSATGLPAWLTQLYPGLSGLQNEDQLAQFMAMSEVFGLPQSWRTGGGADNSLGYANLNWDRERFGQEFPEQIRQWQAQFDANQGQQGWSNQFNQNQFDWQRGFSQSEADRAAQQWAQQFGFNQAEANRAAQQWADQFGFNKDQAMWGRGFSERQQTQAEAQDAWQKAMDEWSKSMQQSQFDWTKGRATEEDKLARENQAMASFGRRFGPNYGSM